MSHTKAKHLKVILVKINWKKDFIQCECALINPKAKTSCPVQTLKLNIFASISVKTKKFLTVSHVT